MRKSTALRLLGGSIASTARELGITYQAVAKWPDPLPDRVADRVLAHLARKHLPPEEMRLLLEEGDQPATNGAA